MDVFPRRLEIDENLGAVYIQIQHSPDPVARSVEVSSGVLLDYDTDGELLGIEIQNAWLDDESEF